MTIYPLIVCTLLYCTLAIGNLKSGDYGHSLMWASYALANVGLLIYEIQKHKGE